MATTRNLSPYELFRDLGDQNTPRFAFTPQTDHATWRAEALPAVIESLGRLPEPVDPNPELIAEFRDGGMIVQRWFIDVQKGASAIVAVNRPADAAPDAPLPAILCWAGHSPNGDYGKEPVMGNASSRALREYIEDTGLEYGRYMVEAGGFVTFSIDWMGQNDRNDSRKPNNRDFANGGHGHWCDTYYLNATLLGFTPLGMNLMHGMRAVDFASTLPFVDAARLGVMGESSGGTLSLWSTLLDDRLRATEVICYSDTFRDFALRDIQYCGSQITPGLFTLVDVSDLQGLVAPGPLLVDAGAYDPVFRLESSAACIERTRQIFASAGSADRFASQIFPGPHGWRPGLSVPFFQKHLGA